MKPLLHAWAAALLCACAVQAQAQSHLPPEAAVREAVARSPAVQAADAAQRGAAARAQALRAGPHETVVRASGQRRWVHDGSGQRFTEGQIAIERPLRLGGKAESDAQLAEATQAASRVAAQDVRHEAARQLLALWFAAQRAGQAQQTARHNADAAAELARVTERRLRAGDAARLDAELAAAEYARMQAALATAQAAHQAAQADLQARFPGLEAARTKEGEAAPPLLDLPPQPPAQLRLRYIEHSHEYLLAQAEETLALRQARRADLERRPDPTVGVFATSERGGSERIAGVSLSVPLGSVHRQAQADQALADADAALSRRLAAERRLGAEFDVLWSLLAGKRAAAQAQARAATLQQGAADRALRAYRAGESGLTELLAVRRTLAEALLAERLARSEALEGDSRLRLDLHELWDFDD
ncbi:TolC family protein [Delftia tsuruhatensis]|uniref:TolC family protein n=1 Tax=Pseudomonadota TaxID=1224 RepID=UPI00077340A2|nr:MULTISPECIES: TolC family protein [Pseudomonadota]MDH0777036.1 TolC family protein [Delftia tsuruhatensis]MDH1460633.1 TolC family protein [Delftia tsuruhatensis]MDH1826640.1 TolC family protein [Delftia tsuruhatensis]MPT00387.1 TolC family protein [Pseudomonas sp.]MPT51973.1 TolC family protein [Delftia sp.]